MIDAVMYGMMPSAKIAKRVSAPPEKRLRNETTPPASRPRSISCWTAAWSMPGFGMFAPSR